MTERERERQRWLEHYWWFAFFNLVFAIPVREAIWLTGKEERQAAA